MWGDLSSTQKRAYELIQSTLACEGGLFVVALIDLSLSVAEFGVYRRKYRRLQ